MRTFPLLSTSTSNKWTDTNDAVPIQLNSNSVPFFGGNEMQCENVGSSSSSLLLALDTIRTEHFHCHC